MANWLPLLLSDRPDFSAIEAAFPFAPDMAACPQDAVFHAEGDVWTHTCMVVKALCGQPGFADLPEERRKALLLAAWFHDVGKPRTTVREWDADLGRERIRQPGHARLGARIAWHRLWEEGASRPLRERVYWLCAWHQRPFHLWHARDMRRDAITFGIVGGWSDLLRLARADAIGRIAPDLPETLASLELLELWLAEEGLLDTPWPFENAESRLCFLRKLDRSPHFAAPAASGSRAVLLSGLPGAGKDTYAAAAFPDHAIVSLDRLRNALDIGPEDAQGPVIQAACEEARKHLRKRAPFVWNATNLTRALRERVIGLCLDYDAHVDIHAIDRPLDVIFRQNEARPEPVPRMVIARLAEKSEPPSLLEAHDVTWA